MNLIYERKNIPVVYVERLWKNTGREKSFLIDIYVSHRKYRKTAICWTTQFLLRLRYLCPYVCICESLN